MSSPPTTPGRPHLSHSTSSHSTASNYLHTPSAAPTRETQVYNDDEDEDRLLRTPSPLVRLPLKSTPDAPSIGLDQKTRATYRILDLTMPSISSMASLTGSAVSDSSGVLPRPSIDPNIRGQPQGWDDDPTIPIQDTIAPQPSPSSMSSRPVFPSAQTQTLTRPSGFGKSGQPHHVRLNSFRGLGDTRSRLSTWRDRAFPELAEGRRRREEADSRGHSVAAIGQSARRAPPPSSSGLRAGSSISASTPTLYAQTSARPAPLGVSVPSTSHDPSTIASTIGSDEDFSDLFIPYSKLSPISPITPSTTHPVRHILNPTTSYSSTTASTFIHSSETSPPTTKDRDGQSITSTQSSSSRRNRDRVMGLQTESSRLKLPATASRLFLAPDVNDVLPFASSRLYSAWDLPQSLPNASHRVTSAPYRGNSRVVKPRRQSVSASDNSRHAITSGSGKFASTSTGSNGEYVASLSLSDRATSQARIPGWRHLPRPISGLGQKRIWVGADGQVGAGVYRVGWEKEILDLESRLHETMYDLAGDKHTFIPIDEGEPEPKTVLDIGTGLGLWPISQALLWRNTQFVGLDAVPCQLDLGALSRAENMARSTSEGAPKEEGLWEGVEKRITWDQANFLTNLPYDTGVFDMVHIRFVSLGVPESAWPSLLDEASRVLTPGGHLEIVELSICLPPSAPASLSRSFASMLLAEMINSDPSVPIRFTLPMLDGLQSRMVGPVFEKQGDVVLDDAGLAWVQSSLEYKGTGIERAGNARGGLIHRIKRGLGGCAGGMWEWHEDDVADQIKQIGEDAEGIEEERKDGPKVWAWVGKKKA